MPAKGEGYACDSLTIRTYPRCIFFQSPSGPVRVRRKVSRCRRGPPLPRAPPDIQLRAVPSEDTLRAHPGQGRVCRVEPTKAKRAVTDGSGRTRLTSVSITAVAMV